MRLRVDLLPRPPYDEPRTVVIDVLRATTSIALLLERGAREVWVTARARTARAAAGEGDLLLGEREGIPPEGFHHGTSPRELERLDVAGRRVYYTSDHLPLTLERLDRREGVWLASLRNAPALVARLEAEAPEAVALVCAGFRGAEALDDALAAGYLVRALEGRGLVRDPTDAARLSSALLAAFPNPAEGLWRSASGRFLHGLGYTDDLAVASWIGADEAVPELSEVRELDGRPLFRFVPAP